MTRTRNSRIHRERGTTLIEVLVAVFVLSLVSLGIYAAFRGVIRLQRIAHIRTVATYVANEQLEVARNLPYQDVGTTAGIPNGVLLASEQLIRESTTFMITRTIRNIDDPFDGTLGGMPDDLSPADYKMVEIGITCTACDGFEGISVTGRVAPLGLETSAGNGALFIQVINAQAQPIADAAVHIENQELDPIVVIDDVTGADGMLRIVDAPPEVQSYHIEITKAGFTSDQTYAPGDLAPSTPVKLDATVAEGGVTQVTLSIDQVSTIQVASRTSLCAPVGSFDFRLEGSRLLGTTPDLPKYAQDLVTAVGGGLTLSDMEWDIYDIIGVLDAGSDIAGTIPALPFTLNPNATQNLDLILEAQTAHRLRVTVLDQGSGLPVAGASARLQDGGGYDETQLTGQGAVAQTDWSGGSGQADFTDPTRYESDDGNVDVLATPGDVLLADVLGQYAPDGALTSSTIDFGSSVNYVQITFGPAVQPPLAGPDAVRLQVATNNDNATWNYLGPDGTNGTYYTAADVDIHPSHDGDQYFRYRLYLHTDDLNVTPNISDIAVTYVTDCVPPGQTFFSGLASTTYTLDVTAPGYTAFNGMVAVNGYTNQTVNLSP